MGQTERQDDVEGRYEVVWPLAPKARTEARHGAERLGSLSDKRIAFMWDYLFQGDVIFERIQERMRSDFPDVEFIDHTVFGNIHGTDEDEYLLTVPDRLRDSGADAVVVAVGA